jgi:hypothetical protein
LIAFPAIDNNTTLWLNSLAFVNKSTLVGVRNNGNNVDICSWQIEKGGTPNLLVTLENYATDSGFATFDKFYYTTLAHRTSGNIKLLEYDPITNKYTLINLDTQLSGVAGFYMYNGNFVGWCLISDESSHKYRPSYVRKFFNKTMQTFSSLNLNDSSTGFGPCTITKTGTVTNGTFPVTGLWNAYTVLNDTMYSVGGTDGNPYPAKWLATNLTTLKTDVIDVTNTLHCAFVSMQL